MPNMRLTKLPAREQDPNIRNCNFEEVSQGYDEAMAVDEAKRCLNCKHKPCVDGCPAYLIDAGARIGGKIRVDVVVNTGFHANLGLLS